MTLKKRLNYLLIHMESLNVATLRMNEECFPNIYKIIERSTFYNNYYSSSTSTYMVITDLIFGETGQFEDSDYLEDIFSIRPTKQTLFDVLQGYGYHVKQFCYGNDENEVLKLKNVICKNEDTWADENLSRKKFLDDFERDLTSEGRFAYFIENVESHISRIAQHKMDGWLSDDLFLQRYRQLDKTIGGVFDALSRQNKLSDTVVVLYGDHGDDFFLHGFHDGYMHAIEPYTYMTHCPLIVYSPEKTPSVNNSLVSTIDIFSLSMDYLDIMKSSTVHDVVYSRNLFAGQNLSKNSFNKSYSVTDGKYTMLVSNLGLKLFNNNIDEYNSFNVLDLFKLKGNGIKFKAYYDGFQSGHFRAFMTEDYKAFIENEYLYLLEKLKICVKTLYGDNESGMKFDRIAYKNDDKIERIRLSFRCMLKQLQFYLPTNYRNALKKLYFR